MGEVLEPLPLGLFMPLLRLAAEHWVVVAVGLVVVLVGPFIARSFAAGFRDGYRRPAPDAERQELLQRFAGDARAVRDASARSDRVA